MLMNMKGLLSIADQRNFAVPAFNIGTGQILNGVIECCQEMRAPVILAVHPDELEFQGDHFIKSCIDAAQKATVPVVIHLDHGPDRAAVLRAVRAGFTSVMIDASHQSFAENIRISKEIVNLCHPLGISVEAELGTIGTTGNDTEGGSDKIIYTNPEDAEKFVAETGVDTLAIAIGTAHGIYPQGFKPELKLHLLKEIKSKVRIPLVLHGGSANPDAEIAESVRLGVNKINISSDMKDAFYQQVRITLANNVKMREPFEIYADGIKEMKKVIAHKIRLFQDDDKAQYYHMMSKQPD